MSYDYLDPFVETLGHDALEQIQLKKMQLMLHPILQSNQFYQRKLRAAGFDRPEDLRSLEDLKRLPFTTKHELSADQAENRPYSTTLTVTRHE